MLRCGTLAPFGFLIFFSGVLLCQLSILWCGTLFGFSTFSEMDPLLSNLDKAGEFVDT